MVGKHMSIRRLVAAALLVAPLLSTVALAAGDPNVAVSSTEVPKAFLDGTFYFNTATEGGSDIEEFFWFNTALIRVKFEMEDRFLAVRSVEDAYSNEGDPSVVSVLARFPAEDLGDSLRVRWGDDPTPSVFSADGEVYRGEGAHDVRAFELDEANQYLTFVKRQVFASTSSGEQVTLRMRLNFLKMGERPYQPMKTSGAIDEDFGFFKTVTAQLTDEETGYLANRGFYTRMDLSKPWVWELHPTVPEIAEKPIRDAIEEWNDVFEAAIGKRPLALQRAPKEHMPGDLRHHMVYFRARSNSDSSLSAYATRAYIQHTGELVDGNVTLPAYRFLKDYRAASQAVQAQAAARAAKAKKKAEAGGDAHPEASGSTPRLRLGSLDMPPSGDRPDPLFEPTLSPEEEEKLAAAYDDLYNNIRGTTAHEIGHCLGLRHNFAGSADMKNLEGDQKSTSIMDYHTKSEHFRGPGAYDRAAIARLYGGEAPGSQGGRFLFGTDHHKSNPLVNLYDSGEPLDYFIDRIELVFGALRRGEKPSYRVRQFGKAHLERFLPAIGSFVGGIEDERSTKAYAYLLELVRTRFPEDAKYQDIQLLSVTRYSAARHGIIQSQKLTRRQRRELVNAMADAIADRTQVLERERRAFAKLLGRVQDASALRALKRAEAAIEANLESEGMREKDLEVEDNVLLVVQQAQRAFRLE